MANVDESVLKVLSAVTDEALLQSDYEQISDWTYSNLDPIEYEGIAIRVPSLVRAAKVGRFPAMVVVHEEEPRLSELPLGDNCFIVAHDLVRGVSLETPCFLSPAEKIPLPPSMIKIPPPLPGAAPETSKTVVEFVDLRQSLGIGNKGGRYAVTAFSYNWVSNTAVTEVSDPKTERQRVHIQDAIAVMAIFSGSRTPSEERLPDYRKSPSSPSLSGLGAALAVQGMYTQQSGRLPVHGAFSVEILDEWLVEPLTPDALGDLKPGDDTVYTRLPLAIVPALIVIARKGVPTPIMLDFKVPIMTDSGLKARDVIHGFFSVDLAAALPQTLPVGQHAVYLSIGPYVDGPYDLEVRPQ